MTVVNTNVKALFAQNALSINNRTLNKAMQELSTGVRINSAKDDAAGLAISTRMSASLRGMTVAIRNANDGISMMQTAEGALGEISNMLQRMRELSAQAATGSLASSNRQALQAELDQLVAEIDNVAKTTNFNGIKLLDGSASSVSLQTGVNEGDQVTVEIEAASSKTLGLQGMRIEGQVTSGRVGASLNSLAVDDVLINGKAAFAAAPALTTSAEAKELAAAINSNIGQHRVQATAFNTVKGVAPTATVFATGDISINATNITAASSLQELVSNINRDAAGVTAVLADDGSIELSNDTGLDIVVGGTSASTIAKAGLTGATYTGYVTLNSLDNADITIKAKSVANGYTGGAGTVADVQAMGFNESFTGAAASGGTVSTAAIAVTDDIRINGVQIGTSADSSALSKAAAINAVSAQSGVQASALTKATLTVKMDGTTATSMTGAAAGTTFAINGKTVALGATTTSLAALVTTINAAGVNGLTASADDSGRLILTSSSGADITVLDGSNAFVTAVTDTVGSTVTAAASTFTVKGRIELSSDNGSDIRVESKAGTAAATLLGIADQGGSDTVVGGALSITTQESAGRALTAIDGALDDVAMNRANLGAFQNRLTAAVDNLSSSSTNLSEARGRIIDTDYAKATTELARSQIIQQAATAMLAQANQQPQTVLSLLQ
jgi:flagellin